jgi:hypothetical protein
VVTRTTSEFSRRTGSHPSQEPRQQCDRGSPNTRRYQRIPMVPRLALTFCAHVTTMCMQSSRTTGRRHMGSGQSGLSEWERRQRASAREADRQQKAAERAQAAAEKEAKRKHAEARATEVEAKNRSLAENVQHLEKFLQAGLRRSAHIDLRSKPIRAKVPPLDLGSDSHPIQPPPWGQFAPHPPGTLSRLLGGVARYERDLPFARDRHRKAVQAAAARDCPPTTSCRSTTKSRRSCQTSRGGRTATQ